VHASEQEYDRTELLTELEREMLDAAEKLDFERAAVLRDRIREMKEAPTLEATSAGNPLLDGVDAADGDPDPPGPGRSKKGKPSYWKPRSRHLRQ
jgi:excinuclease ABC subunit B